jgi:glycosyltransferase involved in cell wall biosynthesis
VRRVLMVAYHFPPLATGGVRRTLEFVRHLPEYGWQPLVLTIDPRTSHYKSDPASLSSIPEGLVVVRTPTCEPLWAFRNLPRCHMGRLIDLLMPVDRSVTWVGTAVRAGLRMIEEFDPEVIYSSSSPYSAHLIAWRLHQLTKIPWVADWRDLWTQCIAWQGPTLLHLCFHRWLERLWWQAAAVTVTHSLGHRCLIQRDLPTLPGNRLEAVLMGYDPGEFETIKAKKYEKFTILYVGTFYGVPVLSPQSGVARIRSWLVDHFLDPRGIRYLTQDSSPLYFLRALRQVLDARPELSERIQVHFLGFPRAGNVDAVKQLGLEDVVQHVGQVPFGEAVGCMKGAHILLLVMLPSEEGRSDFVPSKVPEYIGAQRPILAMIPARDAIMTLYQRHESGTLDLKPDQSVLSRLAWSHLAKQMASVLYRAVTCLEGSESAPESKAH